MSIANELITRGWHQGDLDNPETGAVCLQHAAGLAAGLRGVCAVSKVLQRSGAPGMVTWNDTPGRTFDEVLRVAKEADEILERTP